MLSISWSSARRPVQWILFEQWMLLILTLVRLLTQSPMTSLDMLTRCGLGKQAVGWVGHWWSCQSQRDMMNGTKSSRRNATSNVPHRFTLEPVESTPSVIAWVTKLSVVSGSLWPIQTLGGVSGTPLVCATQQECAAIQQHLDREDSS